MAGRTKNAENPIHPGRKIQRLAEYMLYNPIYMAGRKSIHIAEPIIQAPRKSAEIQAEQVYI